ncbi:MAG: phosphatidylglycerol lysyltransferase domain-containing protein [Candidatus Omnitrophica bacterium]|nr:phosphatidylglycerol lysyltransferase domain-containing protein [Candidatus Omnitrophota bacterium]
MKLKKISLKDREIFNDYLALAKPQLSVYAFENIYIWRTLFNIQWAVIKDNLCVFFQDKIGCFLYIPPQGETQKPEVIEEVFMIMDKFNSNKNISRIENIEEKDLSIYRDLGYECKEKFSEYLCSKSELVKLTGDRFKSKRSAFNYFVRNYEYEYMPFTLKYRDSCLKLYSQWMNFNKTKNEDSLYQGLLSDSRICLEALLDDYEGLGIIGRVVKMQQEIKAFTFGFKISEDIFCILYEITDLSVKGLAQFIFRVFCKELAGYKYINIMDDSGLANLKRVKLSYRPIKLIPSYIVTRKCKKT